MDRFADGFMTKCAEHGLPYEMAMGLLKIAVEVPKGPRMSPHRARAYAMVDRSRKSMKRWKNINGISTPFEEPLDRKDITVSVKRKEV